MSYQRGDRVLTGQGGRIYYLRLTFGALAQVCDVLVADSFSALAGKMREQPKEAIKAFADAMLNAASCETKVDARDLPKLSEAVSGMIDSVFTPPPSFQDTSSTQVGEVEAKPSEGAIPFTSWLKIAVQIYRLSPSKFWAMSVSDFFALLPEPQTPPGREKLSQLMTQFPDEAPK